ncbi:MULTISPECIES: tRNA adenosine(34) deaminase TadA [unclassified Acinetobacter]|uniref:tRNA adenosine(34) deaminase TadA n=1 Tax=unclassified Acinetobacter TaxID=196816 RepID=UPI0035B8325D
MDFMRLALQQAQLAEQLGEVPVGAVLVHDGQVLAMGYNCPIATHDPTAHAEIQAIRHACQQLQNYRLPENCTLYVTLEPCTQCVGALIHARVARVVFAAFEPRAGSLVSSRQLLNDGFYNHYFEFVGGCLADESQAMLKSFFKVRREKAKLAE